MSKTNRHAYVQNFSGYAPLFPLPSVVTFPHVLTPLHVFEPRYRRLTEDALESNKLIAMALIDPGHPKGSSPPIRPIVCLGAIIAHDRLPDGRFNLILEGLSRARLIEERPTELPYRIGKLDLCGDIVPDHASFAPAERLEHVLDLFGQLDDSLDLAEVMKMAADPAAPLSVICDVLTAALQPPAPIAQAVLEALDVEQRCGLVEQLLQNAVTAMHRKTQRVFPPPFSQN